MKNLIVLLVLVATYFPIKVEAQTPRVSIQGTLKDSKGSAAANGTYTVHFKLYNTPTLGTAIWTEIAQVDVVGGIYSHYLGSITPLNGSDFNNLLFLGVKVGDIELSPRTELTYAPYAFAVNKVICSGAVGDVKYSILNPTQFAAKNGSCWIPMDGRAIPNSTLKAIMGVNNVPDGGGMFIRMQEFAGGADKDPNRDSNSPIASVQFSEVKPHSHSVSETAHTHVYRDFTKMEGVAYTNSGAGQTNHVAGDDETMDVLQTTSTRTMGATVNNTGDLETRPKNLNFWIYVRIN